MYDDVMYDIRGIGDGDAAITWYSAMLSRLLICNSAFPAALARLVDEYVTLDTMPFAQTTHITGGPCTGKTSRVIRALDRFDPYVRKFVFGAPEFDALYDGRGWQRMSVECFDKVWAAHVEDSRVCRSR